MLTKYVDNVIGPDDETLDPTKGCNGSKVSCTAWYADGPLDLPRGQTAPGDNTTRNNSVGRGDECNSMPEHRRFCKQPGSIVVLNYCFHNPPIV